MKHLFIPYELAIIAKEKGFNELCLGCYASFYKSTEPDLYTEYKEDFSDFDVFIEAPIYQQILDWLDNKGICIFISPYEAGKSNGSDLNFVWEIINKETKLIMKTEHSCYDERTQALKVAIEEALKLIKE